MKRAFWAMAVILAGVGAAVAQERTPPPPQISVTGEGRIETAPDMARITLGVSFEAREARVAVDAVSQAVAQSLEHLEDLGIAPGDIQTRSLTLNPIRSDKSYSASGPQKVSGFHAANTVIVRVRDLAALGGILDGVLDAGANQFSGLTFGVQDPDPLVVRARRAAVADAMARAALLAEAAGVTLGPILSLSDQGAGVGGFEAMSARRGGGVRVAPGEISINASVSMVFAIEN